MSYVLIEARLQTLVRAIPRFSTHPEAVTIGDANITQRGLDDVVIFLPGPVNFPEPDQTHSGFSALRTREYDVLFSVLRRFVTYAVTVPAFSALREEVLAQIENYPSLDSLVIPGARRVEYISLSSDGDPYGVLNKANEGPFHWAQDFRARYRVYFTMPPGLGH